MALRDALRITSATLSSWEGIVDKTNEALAEKSELAIINLPFVENPQNMVEGVDFLLSSAPDLFVLTDSVEGSLYKDGTGPEYTALSIQVTYPDIDTKKAPTLFFADFPDNSLTRSSPFPMLVFRANPEKNNNNDKKADEVGPDEISFQQLRILTESVVSSVFQATELSVRELRENKRKDLFKAHASVTLPTDLLPQGILDRIENVRDI